jgi:hypothetical protein
VRTVYVVEIGLLHRERPIVQVSFYRKNEDKDLDNNTKDQIISGIYMIVPEIFKNHVLRRLNIAKYTILFKGFWLHPEGDAGNDPAAKTTDTSTIPLTTPSNSTRDVVSTKGAGKAPGKGNGKGKGNPKDTPPATGDPDRMVLGYAIVDLMADDLDETYAKVVQAKMDQMGTKFNEIHGKSSLIGMHPSDLEPFKVHIIAIFKDLLKKPEDRFDDMWLKKAK